MVGINKYFDNIITYIENKDNYSTNGKNKLIDANNSNYELDYFGVHFIPNSHTQELRNQDIKEDSGKKDGNCIETCCDETPCSTMCIVF